MSSQHAGSQQHPTEGGRTVSRTDTELAYQGVGRRAVAIVIDSFLGIVTFFAAGFLVGSVTGETTATGFQLEGASAMIVFGLVALIGLAYYVLLEAYYGQTLGKRLVGIRVVSQDGSEITLSESVMRNLIRIIDAVGFYLLGAILVWTSEKNQRLGDRIGDTVVVSA
jgi:uncharacterized RDD family membrane protein YckC